jgi:integrase
MPVRKVRGTFYWETMVGGRRYSGTFNGKDGERIPADEREALDLVASIRIRIRDGSWGRHTDSNFAAFVDKVFLPYARANHADPRHAEFRAAILKEHFGRYDFGDITRMMIERFIRDRLSTTTVRTEVVGKRKVNKSRSPTTVRKEVAVLSQIFNHARQERLVLANPCDEVGRAVMKAIPARRSRNRYCTPEEELKLVEQLKERRAHLLPAVRLALWTGMRRGEILRLAWADLNFTGKTVTRNVKGEEWKVAPDWLLVRKSKNGRPRTIPMCAKVREMLYLMSEDATRGTFVFQNLRTGTQLLDIKRGYASAVREAGIDNLTFHDLRHTWATRADECGASQAVIRDILGHSPTSVTGGYTHSRPEARERAVEAVANFVDYEKLTKKAPAALRFAKA